MMLLSFLGCQKKALDWLQSLATKYINVYKYHFGKKKLKRRQV